MRVPQTSNTKIKNYIHGGQAFILVLAWVLTIAVFAQDGSTHAATAWYFALVGTSNEARADKTNVRQCWLTIPILIYLVMVPMWSRTQHLANVYAFIATNGISAILWLSAWAAVAAYVSAGKAAGTEDGRSGCDNFGFGAPSKCKLSEATVILGVFVMLLFVATTYLSVQKVLRQRQAGVPLNTTKPDDFALQSQEAFSSNMDQERFGPDTHFDTRQGGPTGFRLPSTTYEAGYTLLHARNEDVTNARPVQPVGPLSNQHVAVLSDDATSHDTRGRPFFGQIDGADEETQPPPPPYGVDYSE